jgi:hypothetical protein
MDFGRGRVEVLLLSRILAAIVTNVARSGIVREKKEQNR